MCECRVLPIMELVGGPNKTETRATRVKPF